MSEVRLIDANELKRDFAELCATECAICSFYISRADVGECHCGLIDRAPTIAKCGRTSDGFPFMDLRPKPTGKWEKTFSHNGKTYHRCTNCHVSSQLILVDNYCPNCGAKMKGGKEE